MHYNQRVTISQLLRMLENYKFKEFHIHHTWKPDYSSVKRHTPELINDGMKRYHKKVFNSNTIAQHITTFPSGLILIGRHFSKTPISIKGRNTGAFAMEMVGNFDWRNDIITVAQRNVTLHLIRYFKRRKTKIVFHRDYSFKTCPGMSLHKKGLIQASEYYLDSKELRRGITGTDVAELQKNLKIKVDGSFGPDTEIAVKSWQFNNGYKEDGIVTRRIYEKINNISVEKGGDKLEKWKEEMGKKALENLVAKKIINNPEIWEDKMGEKVELWHFLTVANRLM